MNFVGQPPAHPRTSPPRPGGLGAVADGAPRKHRDSRRAEGPGFASAPGPEATPAAADAAGLPASEASGPTPLLFSLSEPVDVGDPAVCATDPALVASLETQAADWVRVVERVSQRVREAPPVHAETLVKDLPLAELLRRAGRGEAAAHGEQRARVRAELVQLTP